MFEKGDYIVYGTNGVCEVEDYMDVDEGGSARTYYVLTPVRTRGTRIYSPVNNKKVLMRSIISRQEAAELLDSVEAAEVLALVDSRAQEQQYKDVLRTCSCEETLRLIKSIYKRMKEREAAGRKVTAVDEKYIYLAKDNLYNELAIVLDVDVEEVDRMFTEKLEKCLSVAV